MKKELEIIIKDMEDNLERLMKYYDEAVNDDEEAYYAGKYNILQVYYKRLLKVIENENIN